MPNFYIFVFYFLYCPDIFFMRKLLFFLTVLILSHVAYGQVSPIFGPPAICKGTVTTFSDATVGGSWSSSNPGIVSIGTGTGIATGVAVGSATITYTVITSYVTAVVNVNPVPTPIYGPNRVCNLNSVQLNDTTPGGTWSSSNITIATVGSLTGLVTGVSPGSPVNIRYTLGTGCFAQQTMTVNPLPLPITGISTVATIVPGDTSTLYDLTPGGYWTTSNNTLATINYTTGLLRGVSTGLLAATYTLAATGCYMTRLVAVNQIPDTGVVGNLMAWYPFCNDTIDHSPIGRDLINSGLVTTPAIDTSDRYGFSHAAFSFNGVNSEMHYNTFFPTTSTSGDFTYSVWMYPYTLQRSVILYNGFLTPGPGSNGFGFVMDNGSAPGVGDSVSVMFGGVGKFLTTWLGSSPLGSSLNTWHNLVLVKNGNSYRFYLDGATVGFFISPFNPLSAISGSIFTVGNNSTNAYPFNGKIDDIAVYNRQLSQVERLELYNFDPNFRKFTLGNDTIICADSIMLRPKPQTVGSVYTWSTGFSTITDTTYTVYPPALLFGGTTYILNMSRPYGCKMSDTVVIYKIPIPVHLLATTRDTNICLGDTLRLTQNYPASRFLWSTGDTTHFLDVYQTGKYSVTIDSTYYFTRLVPDPTTPGTFIPITDSSVCVGRDTVTVRTVSVPLVNIGPDYADCRGLPDTLRNAYPHLANHQYTWSNGATDDSIFAIVTGLYWLKVNDSGCIRIDSTNVLIVFDTMTLFQQDTAICLGGWVKPRISINSIIQYQWTPTTGIPFSNIAQPTITPDTSATYVVRGTYPGCPDIVDSFHIDVQPNPVVYAGGNRTVCEFDTIRITAGVNPTWYTKYIYKWTPSTYLDKDSTQTVFFTGGDTTMLILKVSTPAGCYAIDSAQVIVHTGNFALLDTVIDLCPGDSVQLRDSIIPGSIATHVWHPSAYLDDSTFNAPWVHPITSTQYIGYATSQYGCKDTLFAKINVRPNAIMYLGDSVILHPGESYQIPTSSNCNKYSWTPTIGLNDTTSSNPIATPDVNTKYKVKGVTPDGCVVYDSISIRVDPGTIINVPNAFTPGTGVNNILYIVKKGLATVNSFRIFNRWGVTVYESHDINAGWDGKYNGSDQPFGVYVYELEAVTEAGKIVTKRGNITLIR